MRQKGEAPTGSPIKERKTHREGLPSRMRLIRRAKADGVCGGCWESSSFLPFLEEKDMRSAAEREAQVHVQPVMCPE